MSGSYCLLWMKKLIFIMILWGTGRGESWSFTKCATLCPSLSCENHAFKAFIFLSKCQYMGYYFFPLRTVCAGDPFVISDSEKVDLECMATFTCNTFLSQRQTCSMTVHSILSWNHCISLCCLLRLAKKINYFHQKPCCVLIERKL